MAQRGVAGRERVHSTSGDPHSSRAGTHRSSGLERTHGVYSQHAPHAAEPSSAPNVCLNTMAHSRMSSRPSARVASPRRQFVLKSPQLSKGRVASLRGPTRRKLRARVHCRVTVSWPKQSTLAALEKAVFKALMAAGDGARRSWLWRTSRLRREALLIRDAST